jgi:hypothetical protein
MTPSAWLSRVAVCVVILALAGCADHDRQSLRECAEASALKTQLMAEYSNLIRSPDPAMGAIRLEDLTETLRFVSRWKDSVCPKVATASDKRQPTDRTQ